MKTAFKYCKKCVMPNTKPDLFFDEEGICDACRSAEIKSAAIDWEARKKEFENAIVAKYKSKNSGNYDCIIPVSGGKDSHYQVYLIKEIYKMNPLLVSFESSSRTELGRKNLDNIKKAFGCDLIVFEKNPEVYRKMSVEGFKRVGDEFWPNHIGIFTVPVRLAVQMKIPLIIWGENSQLEYGGPKASRMKNILDRRWLEEFGGLLGLRIEDVVGVDGVREEDIVSYKYPSEVELKAAGITGVFLGYYFKWDARKQVELIKKYGFSVKEDGPVEGTYTSYENLDEEFQSVHDYLKFVKFGFGRATDHASIDARNGRMSRAEAVETVKKYDGKFPAHGMRAFLKFSGLGEDEFRRVIDSFTDKALFLTDGKGGVQRDAGGNLIKRYQNYDL
ncbi:MAG: N-acetyl sugar amidotransferase [Candidatus Giovannonibacteria bacterium]|nr:N-acetyl sugar amidotransferase [Candidatus Giovannonibacteria bacterium]